MDMNLMLGVTGVVLTALFGAWAVALAVRTKYPGKLTIYLEQGIPLFESIVKSVPDLSVAFQGEPVEPGLVLLKCILLNEGAVDIHPTMVAEPLQFLPPDGWRWLGATVTATTPKVEAHIDRTTGGIALTLGLFRKDEYVRFDLVAQAPAESVEAHTDGSVADVITQTLVISHRIANTQTTRLRKMPAEVSGAGSHRVAKATLILGLFGAAMYAGLLLWKGMPADIHYQVAYGNRSRWVSVIAQPNNLVVVTPIDWWRS